MQNTPKKRIYIALIVTIIAIAAGSWFWCGKIKTTKEINGNKQGAQNEIVFEKVRGNVSMKSSRRKDLVYNAEISLDVPINWRTTQEDYSRIPLAFHTLNDNLLKFNFLASNAPYVKNGGLIPHNHLSFYNVTDWMKDDSRGGHRIIMTNNTKDKSEYFNFLVDLRDKNGVVNFSECADIFGICRNNIASTYIESSDGLLSGFSSIRVSQQSLQYDPKVYVYMSGIIEGEMIYVEGEFALYDSFSKNIDNLKDDKEKRDDITKNSIEILQRSLPEDTAIQYQEMLNSIRSLKFAIIN